jgi:hypothetical protein
VRVVLTTSAFPIACASPFPNLLLSRLSFVIVFWRFELRQRPSYVTNSDKGQAMWC